MEQRNSQSSEQFAMPERPVAPDYAPQSPDKNLSKPSVNGEGQFVAAEELEVPQVQVQPEITHGDTYPGYAKEAVDPLGGAQAIWDQVQAGQEQLMTALQYHKISEGFTEIKHSAHRGQ